MHAMEAKGQELVRKKTTLLTERRMLLDAVQNLVDAPAPTPSDDGDVDMDALFGLIASAEDVRRLKAEAQEKKLAELERAARAPPPPQPSAEASAPTAAGAAASSSSASTAQVDALAQVRFLHFPLPSTPKAVAHDKSSLGGVPCPRRSCVPRRTRRTRTPCSGGAPSTRCGNTWPPPRRR